MAILQKDFFSNLSAFTLVQTQGTVTASSNTMVLHETTTDSGNWDRIRACHTASQALANAQVIYCQFSIADKTVNTQMIFHTLASSTTTYFSNTFGAYLSFNGSELDLKLYDDNAGPIGSGASISSATVYDLKFTLDSGFKGAMAYRATTAAGNLPASTGAYTSIGTSSTASPANIFMDYSIRTANPNTDLTIQEYYFTDNGSFNPADPTSLIATAISSTEIDLSWSDSNVSAGETGVKVERSITSGSGFSQIGTAAFGTTTYNDTTCSPSTKYYYRIRAYVTLHGTDYHSSYTSESTATTSSGSDNGANMLALEALG